MVVPGGDAAASGGGEDDADEDGGECAGVEEDDPIIYSFSLSLADEFGFEEGPVDVLNIMRLFFANRATRLVSLTTAAPLLGTTPPFIGSPPFHIPSVRMPRRDSER